MPKKKDPAVRTLDEALKRRTTEGVLYEPLDGGKLRCFACGHRCVIPDGFDGICKVRFNRDGRLLVPRAYVGGLQVDPIEKKPFFHAFPGAVALSFGMLGCDYHCGYCFAPGTRVLTSRGHLRIEEIHSAGSAGTAGARVANGESDVPGPAGLTASTHLGRLRPVARVFRHHHRGRLIRIRPAALPAVEVTAEHPFLVSRRTSRRDPGTGDLQFVTAGEISIHDRLVVPRRHAFSEAVTLPVAELLSPFATTFTARRTIGRPVLESILSLTRSGRTSRQIGESLGIDPSHVRHLRSKIERGEWQLDRLNQKPARVLTEHGRVRLSNEHSPGIPAEIHLDRDFARLLGLFCAEGSVSRAANRPHASRLVFSFGRHEEALVGETSALLRRVLGLNPGCSRRRTTIAVYTGKTSAALLFKALCGNGSRGKRVPEALFRAHRPIVEAFVEGTVDGDGYRAPNGSTTVSTVSEELAAGLSGLLIKLGILPQWYRYDQPVRRRIQGRPVEQAGMVHIVRWHPARKKPANVEGGGDCWLVPIREITSRAYEGPVYNLETDEDHTYLANGLAVHNCQNWLTSQALRDSEAIAPPRDIDPGEIVSIAKKQGAPVMVSTYNEPLITSEWAVEVFSAAKRAGITCGYVSNGNGTPEVLRYIRPHVDLYKVDLKGFRQENYRELGGRLETVLDTIRLLHEMGFWVEIVTLLVPGFNDSKEELRDITSFLASVSVDIPWHVTAFHRDYKMTGHDDTTARDLIRAAGIGREAGLRYVYAGNLPGGVGDLENTRCPGCEELLIARCGYHILDYRLGPDGSCPSCRTPIAGFWQAGWTVPAEDGGLPGRVPRVVSIPAKPPGS